MAGLLFRYRELVDETEALKRMASPFLATDGQGALVTLKDDLERIGEQTTDHVQEIELRPLRTQPTRDYEAGSRSGGYDIYALIKGNWELKSIGRRGPKRMVAFVGKASAVIELWREDCLWREMREQSKRLAMWRIELGADDAPGCYFHTQVLGDREESPFPKAVSIPRLPSPFVTPMAAVEFALGELFQDKWQEESRRARDPQRRWRSIQKRRWVNLLTWQNDLITRHASQSSPWIDLKHAKPPNDLFLNSV